MYITRFVVEGHGRFPIDMLRYDSCAPDSEEDSHRIARSFDDAVPTSITLKQYHADKRPRVTHERWASFTWRVTQLLETRKL